MASASGVWGIDIGQCALKALKLRSAGDKVEAVAFDVIEHPKVLSQPDADRDELIKAALEKFASRNDWQGDQFVLGIPGQQTFARFCKLPPADPKKIPDLVQYEAGQQIPFDMNDVIWDYQVFANKDSPDVEVGIFAIRKDLIRKHIEYFANVGISPAAVQTVPSALYNFSRYDLKDGDEGATVLIDVGAQNTDLIIAERASSWTRNIPLGGNSFTEALIRAFKLSFAKAESLKKNAVGHKYAKDIFKAMRPVFADLVAEIQRSLGFYASTHRETELKRVLALGNAFRLPGLLKYLESNLTITGGITQLEKFNMLVPSATLNAPQFSENILSFGAAYGLALQGLGLATISASLLPPELARIAVWKKKRLWFVGAAACLAVASALPWTRNVLDQSALAAAASESQGDTNRIVQKARNFRDEFNKVKSNSGQEEENISKKIAALHQGKLVVPRILALVHEAMPELDPQLAQAKTPDEFKKVVKSDLNRFARAKRKQIIIESLDVRYYPNLDAAVSTSGGGGGGSGLAPMPSRGGRGQPMMESEESGDSGGGGGEGATNPGFYVEVSGKLLFGKDAAEANRFFTEAYLPRLKQMGQAVGLGFHVPNEDPKAPEKQNPHLAFIEDYFPQQVSLLGEDPEEQTGKPKPATPPGQNAAQNAEEKRFFDPVTEEDMRKDRKFKFGFKVKLGDKPAEEKKAEDGNQGG